MANIAVFIKGSCASCQKAMAFLETNEINAYVRDIDDNPFNRSEMVAFVGKDIIKNYLNPRSDSYRKHKMKDEVPPVDQVIDLLVEDVNLLKRPILQVGHLRFFGFDEPEWRDALGMEPI